MCNHSMFPNVPTHMRMPEQTFALPDNEPRSLSEEAIFMLARVESVYRQNFERFFFSEYNTATVIGFDNSAGKFVIGLEKCAVCLETIHRSTENFEHSPYRFSCRRVSCVDSLLCYVGLPEDLSSVTNVANESLLASSIGS